MVWGQGSKVVVGEGGGLAQHGGERVYEKRDFIFHTGDDFSLGEGEGGLA